MKTPLENLKAPTLAPKDDGTGASSVPPSGVEPQSSDFMLSYPGVIDVAALAQFYNSPVTNHVEHESLLEEARIAMSKYDLTQAELEIASDSLARTLHMLLEQHGLRKLSQNHMNELERHVLDYCGIQHENPAQVWPLAPPGLSEMNIRRPDTPPNA